jgi:hypothetical protein
MGIHEEDLEGGLLYWGPQKLCYRYIKRDTKMTCKQVSLSIGAPLGTWRGFACRDYLREKDILYPGSFLGPRRY